MTAETDVLKVEVFERANKDLYEVWFEFLQRSKPYREYCQSPLGGQKQLASVFDQFGDVFDGSDFSRWWQENAHMLQSKYRQVHVPVDLELAPEHPGQPLTRGVTNLFDGTEHDQIFIAINLYTPVDRMRNAIEKLIWDKQQEFLGYSKSDRMKREKAKDDAIEYPLELPANVKPAERAVEMRRLLKVLDDYLLRPPSSSESWAELGKKHGYGSTGKSSEAQARRAVNEAKAVLHFAERGRFPITSSGILWHGLHLSHGTQLRVKVENMTRHAFVSGYSLWLDSPEIGQEYVDLSDAFLMEFIGSPTDRAMDVIDVYPALEGGKKRVDEDAWIKAVFLHRRG